MVQNKDILDDLEYLLDNLPLKIHLILSTCTDPLLSVTILCPHGDLLEIHYQDLCVSFEDAEYYLNEQFWLGLKEDEDQVLADYIEDWIIGLHIAASSINNLIEALADIHKLDVSRSEISGLPIPGQTHQPQNVANGGCWAGRAYPPPRLAQNLFFKLKIHRKGWC